MVAQLEFVGSRVCSYAVGAFVAFWLYKFFKLQLREKLPGPRRWPLVGTMLSFNHTRMLQDEYLLHVARRYGDLCALRGFGNDFVMLNTYDVIREAAVTKSNQFVNRKVGHGFTWKQVDPHGENMAHNDFAKIKQTRNTTLSIFRELGVGRAAMEELVADEARLLLDRFRSFEGKAFNCNFLVQLSVLNNIQRVLFNKRFDFDDVEMRRMQVHSNRIVATFKFVFLFDIVPPLRFLPGLRRLFTDFVDANKNILTFMTRQAQTIIDKQSQEELEDQAVESYVQAYTQKHGADSYEVTTVMPQTFEQLFFAGNETTANSMQWTLCLLANRPHVQDKLHAAICDVIGEDGAYETTSVIPYLDAVVWEVQRFCSVVPIAFPHTVSTKDKVTLAGHVVPNDATYIFNLFAVHRDPKTWGDPEQFRPERFLDEDANFVKHSHVIPFGLGKRSCLGELLARQELYIFTANIFHKFRILPPEGVDRVDEQPVFAITRAAPAFELRAVPRR